MTNKQKNQLMIAVLIVGVGVISLLLFTSSGDQAGSPSNLSQPSTFNQPIQNQAFTPQPAGDAPPGKVWSPEHGHWHDATNTSGSSNTLPTIPVQNVPQPAGDAPEGKVWSKEHGHWHDASVIPNITVERTDKATSTDDQ